MPSNNTFKDYLTIFLNDIPLLDVRAPVEFSRGAFPLAFNAPLLDDQQRELIGTEYKAAGQDSAIELGYHLATPEIRQNRIDQWLNFTQQHPRGLLYCFRGGLRSRISQEWIQAAGSEIPYITGGYKAMRRFLIDQTEAITQAHSAVIIAGSTGSGKTEIIHALDNSIDLEGAANHRGSSFGRKLNGQPSQIDFENRLAIDLLKVVHQAKPKILVFEDEAYLIGRCSLPLPIKDLLGRSPLAVLEESMDSRLQRIYTEYVKQALQEMETQTETSANAQEAFADYLIEQVGKIKKRLGGARFKEITELFATAKQELIQRNNSEGYIPCIHYLLLHYYDPMYAYQLENKKDRIAFRGSRDSVIEWVQKQHD